MNKILNLFIILALFQCKSQVKDNSQASSNQNRAMEQQTITVKNQEGLIGYWEPLKKHTINYTQPNTYDSQYTCIVEGELGESYQKQGTVVVFSGTLYQNAETPQPMLGGQQIYWLKLDAIKVK